MKVAKDDGERICSVCGGDGTRQVMTSGGGAENGGYSEQECPSCLGTGLEPFGSSYYPDGVYPTYKIVEATDDAEYAALSAANKAIYGIIVSCGTVDLSEGTAVRDKLLAMFGAGTTTRDNLAALVS